MHRYLMILTALFATSLPVLTQAALPTEEEMKAPMSFSFAEDGWIRAIGKIDYGTDKRFATFLSANRNKIRPGGLVQLFSRGGLLITGVQLGTLINNAGLNTMVGGAQAVTDGSAECASSCTLAFLGGVKRHVSAGASFVVHANSTTREDGSTPPVDEKAFTQADFEYQGHIVALVLTWATVRGVHPLWVAKVLMTPNADPVPLSEEEVRGWRVDNLWPITAKNQAELMSRDRLRQELCQPTLLEDIHPAAAKQGSAKSRRHSH